MILLGCIVLLKSATYAQETVDSIDVIKQLEEQVQTNTSEIKKLKQFKVSGYIQAQFQYGDKNASLKVGNANTNTDKGFNRFGIRRGRIKMTYEKSIVSGVFQLDITEKGLGLKDAYISIKDPWIGSNSIKAGVFDRPFGYEISYSSSKREAPERAEVISTLFPEERDLGAMITLQAPKKSAWHILKLDAAVVAGNGIKLDVDNSKDFIGHLSVNKNIKEQFNISGGISYYRGKVYQGTSTVYRMDGKSFIANNDTSNFKAYTKREYFGIDLQLAVSTKLGMTQLYGEYIFGTQPGEKNGSKSPNATSLPSSNTYIRNFNGYYITFVQDFGKLPLSFIAKYDYYNPNTKVSKNEIGLNGTGKGDIATSTFGTGIMWRINNSLRLTAYYDLNMNEKSSNLSGYDKDIADNVFTMRLQYKF